MRRVVRLLPYGATLAVVLALGKLHAVQHRYDYTGSLRFSWSLAYTAVLCIAAYGVGLPDLIRSRRSAVTAALTSTGAAALGMSFVQLAVGSALLPRFVVFGAPVLLVPLYVTIALMALGGRARQGERHRVFAVAETTEAEQLRADLRQDPEVAATVVGTLEPSAAGSRKAGDGPVVAAVRGAAANVLVLDRVAMADDSIVSEAATVHQGGVRVRTLALFYEEWLGKLPVSSLERASLMFDIGEVHRARYGRLKRIIDVVVGCVGTLLLVAVTPVVLVGNLFSNRGPLLYRQQRVGKNGSVFQILKFRTMRPSSDPADWTKRTDPRVTPFGRWLRRTHLDELPQVVNILRGDLSIVGPRPEQPRYVEELAEKLPFYQLRHLVRPGLTGWAQVKYPYGGDEGDALEKLQYELYYLRHQRLKFDLQIIGRTLRSVIGHDGR